VRRSFILGVLAGVLLAGRAEAGPCFGKALMDEWMAGAQMMSKGDSAGAASRLRPLAEGGFAPAQVLVGQMTAARASSPAELVEAQVWLKLAGRAEARQGLRQIFDIDSKLSSAERSEVEARLKTWKAVPIEICADGARPTGAFKVEPGVPTNGAEAAAWWSGATRDQMAARPEVVPYMMSLSRVYVVSSGPNAAIARTSSGPVLRVNHAVIQRPSADAVTALLPPVKEAVNDIAFAALTDVPTQTYKGRTLQGYPGADNEAFFALVKKGIDLSEGLPPRLKQQAAMVPVIRHRPAFRYGESAVRDIMMVYTADMETPDRSYAAFQSNPQQVSAADVAIGLVGSGTYHLFNREAAQLSGRSDAESKRRVAYLRGMVEKTLPTFPLAEECRIMADEIATMKALGLDEKRWKPVSKRMFQRSCPGAKPD
jgi:hypothetical protein